MSSYVDAVLNLLYSGEKVSVSFFSSVDRTNFRIRLYATKKKQDEILSVLLKEQKRMLKQKDSFVKGAEEPFVSTYWIKDKGMSFSFSVISAEEEEVKQPSITDQDEKENK